MTSLGKKLVWRGFKMVHSKRHNIQRPEFHHTHCEKRTNDPIKELQVTFNQPFCIKETTYFVLNLHSQLRSFCLYLLKTKCHHLVSQAFLAYKWFRTPRKFNHLDKLDFSVLYLYIFKSAWWDLVTMPYLKGFQVLKDYH